MTCVGIGAVQLPSNVLQTGGQTELPEACGNVRQGRRWPEVESRFEEFWSMTLRALDDIKESVRAAAATLVRTLRGLTLRVADPQLSPPDHAKAAIAVALPLLLEKGMFDQERKDSLILYLWSVL